MKNKIKALVVDDNLICNKLVTKILEQVGYDCDSSFTSKEALSVSKNKNYALMILDVNLPDQNGLKLAEELRVHHKLAPIIFLSGIKKRGNKNLIQKSYNIGAVDFLHKPLDGGIFKQKAAYYKAQFESSNKTSKLFKNLKRKQTQIIQYEKLACVGQLAGGIAHEINNPLCVITTNLSVLESYGNKIVNLKKNIEDKLKENDGDDIENALQDKNALFAMDDMLNVIDDMQKAAEKIKSLVYTVGEFAKQDQSNLVEYPLKTCFETSMKILKNYHKYKTDISVDIPEDIRLNCVPNEINQVIINLLSNSIEAIDQNGKIEIIAKSNPGQIILKFIDNGSGIEKKSLNKIFEPFYTTKDISKHRGLGLAVAYNIIKKYNGDISCVSIPGLETRFVVTIPKED